MILSNETSEVPKTSEVWQVCRQKRKSLAIKVTPDGVQVLIPQELVTESPQVQDFIRRGLGEFALPASVPTTERLDKSALLALVEEWSERLGVQVKRVQLRAIRSKWGSVSMAGNLTLARDLVKLPRKLVEYVICHELLHLRMPSLR
jgi:predicted metal-dependent hydrolase